MLLFGEIIHRFEKTSESLGDPFPLRLPTKGLSEREALLETELRLLAHFPQASERLSGTVALMRCIKISRCVLVEEEVPAAGMANFLKQLLESIQVAVTTAGRCQESQVSPYGAAGPLSR